MCATMDNISINAVRTFGKGLFALSASTEDIPWMAIFSNTEIVHKISSIPAVYKAKRT